MRKLLFVILAVAFVTVLAGGRTGDNDVMRWKARHYLLQGYKQQVSGNETEAYELFKKALQLDPDYAEAAYCYGLSKLSLVNDSSISESRFSDIQALLRDYTDTYPSEADEAEIYGRLSAITGDLDEAVRAYKRVLKYHPTYTRFHLMIADLYNDMEQPDSALLALNRYEQAEGASEQLTIQKVLVHLHRQDSVAAVREVDALIATSPRNSDFMALKAELYRELGNTDSLASCLEYAERLDPENGDVKRLIADMLLMQGDTIGYDNKIYEALLMESLDLDDKISILAGYLNPMIYGEDTDKSRADHLFEVLSNQYPHEPEILELSVRWSLAKEDYDKAVEDAGYAIDLNPDNPALWLLKMQALVLQDKYEEVFETYAKSQQFVDDIDIDLLYAAAASLSGDKPGARDAYLAILAKKFPGFKPEDDIWDYTDELQNMRYSQFTQLSEVFNYLGDVYHELGEPELTYRCYDNALLLEPDNTSVLNNYAYFLALENRDLDKALEMAKKATDEFERNSTYLDTYAYVLFKLQDYAKALEVQNLAIESATAQELSFDLYDHLGDIQFMNGMTDEAVESWKKALELEPDNQQIRKKVKNKSIFNE